MLKPSNYLGRDSLLRLLHLSDFTLKLLFLRL